MKVFHKLLILFFAFTGAVFAQTDDGDEEVTLVDHFELTQQVTPLLRSAAMPQEASSLKMYASKWSNGEVLIEGFGDTSSISEPVTFEYKVNLDTRSFEIIPLSEEDQKNTKAFDDAVDEFKDEKIKTKSNAKQFTKKERRKLNKLLKQNKTTREIAKELSPELYTPSVIAEVEEGAAESKIAAAARTSTRAGWHSKGVMVTTYDPIRIPLTQTGTKTLWYVERSGFQRWYRAWRRHWAANPSRLNTHWYLYSKNGSWPHPRNRTLGNINSFFTASYYNSDFGANWYKTYAHQYVWLTAKRDGNISYRWSHRDNGEGAWLIYGKVSLY